MKALIAVLFALVPQDDPAAALLERLRSESVEERDEAGRQLRALGLPALPALERAVKDPDAELVTRAARLLPLIRADAPQSPKLRRLLPGLSEEMVERKRTWAEVLIELLDPEKYPSLRASDFDPMVEAAFESAATIGRKRDLGSSLGGRRLRSAVPYFRTWLSDPNPEVRKAGIFGLSSYEDHETVAHLKPLLADPDADLVRLVVDLCAPMNFADFQPGAVALLKSERRELQLAGLRFFLIDPPEEVIGSIAALMGAPDPEVRANAAELLSGRRSPIAVRTLMTHLKSDDDAVVVETLGLLGGIGDAASAAAVEALLDDPRQQRREAAYHAWAGLCPPTSTRARELARHEDPALAASAIEYLGRSGAPAEGMFLRELLASAPAALRGVIVEALGLSGCRDALPEILPLLGDPDPAVKIAAANSLVLLDLDGTLPRLIAALDDPELRSRVLPALAQAGARDAVPAIARLLSDADPAIRRQAAGALQEIQPANLRELVLPYWRSIEETGSADERREAMLTRAGLGDRAAIGPLLELCDDEDEAIRNRAFAALLPLARPELMRHLANVLKDGGIGRKVWAIARLGGADLADAAPLLLPRLRDKDSAHRAQVLYVLGRLDCREAGPRALPLLRDSDPLVRRAAIDVAVQLIGKPALPQLLPLLSDPEPEVRATAVSGICRLDARDVAIALVPVLGVPVTDFYGNSPQAQVLQALLRWGARETIPAMIPLLETGNSHSRLLVLDGLVGLRATEAVPSLRRRLQEDLPPIRAKILEALAGFGDREALPEIAEALQDEEPEVRVQAARALQALLGEASAPKLRPLLQDPNAAVRNTAAELLPAENPDRIPDSVRAQLHHPSRDVREAAIGLLVRRWPGAAAPLLEPLLDGPSRRAVIQALATLGAVDAIPRALDDSRDAVRREAVEALAIAQPARAVRASLLGWSFNDSFPAPELVRAHLQTPEGRDWLQAALSPSRRGDRRLPVVTWIRSHRASELSPELLPLLADPDHELRRYALHALLDLDPRASGADLAALLRDPDHQVRALAAGGLCRAGSSAGVDELLIGATRWRDVSLFPLNALRNPTLWKTLDGLRPDDPEESRRKRLERLLGYAGVALAVPQTLAPQERDWLQYVGYLYVTDSLLQVVVTTPRVDPFEVVFDGGTLRLLRPHEALAFWKAWAETLPK